MQYTLSCNGTSAIADTTGGELISFVSPDSKEYIWSGNPEFWSGHAPVLFPNVGALKNSSVTFGGEAYTLPKHGFARKTEFVAAQLTESSVEFVLSDSEATRQNYPYSFRLSIRHEIFENGFSTVYSVTNTDQRPIWFCIGGHAGFLCPMVGDFSDYQLRFEADEEAFLYTDSDSILRRSNQKQLIYHKTLALRYSDFVYDVLILEHLRSRHVDLIHTGTGHGLRFEMDGFSALGVWTPPQKNAPFLCLEPWQGLPAFDDETGAFEDKPYAVSLPCAETFTAGYRVSIL